MSEQRELYPELEPYNVLQLSVSDTHTLYVEECGNPNGKPAVFLHGGPGAGLDEKYRRYFDPEVYRIVLFDQRGSGKSTPFASLDDNTTWELVADMERIRNELNIDSWMVFGGSWGSTLGLVYAITHPERTDQLVLRGIFLARPSDVRWLYHGHGAAQLFPDRYQGFLEPLDGKGGDDIIPRYYELLTSGDATTRKNAAVAWSKWEASVLRLEYDQETVDDITADDTAEAFARVECHYFVNDAFLSSNNWILENAEAIRTIPGVIVHGRYDVVCPVSQAWELHNAWPEARLEIVELAGHASSERGIVDALVRATDEFRFA